MHHGAHHALPVASAWGDGTTSSSDRQFFRSARRGDAAGEVNARYGPAPGLGFYTHVSDQHGPCSARLLSATGHEAPYVLDVLLHHGTALRTGTGRGLRHAMQAAAAAAAATAPSTPARSIRVETDRGSRFGRARKRVQGASRARGEPHPENRVGCVLARLPFTAPRL
jgi:hypothetical protein